MVAAVCEIPIVSLRTLQVRVAALGQKIWVMLRQHVIDKNASAGPAR